VNLLDKDPSELWENAANYLVQLELEEEQRKKDVVAKAARDAKLKAAAAAEKDNGSGGGDPKSPNRASSSRNSVDEQAANAQLDSPVRESF
jgi:hypothetical protein